MIFYRFARAVVLTVFKVLFRVRIEGRHNVPKEGVYIVAPSHRSILDIPFTGYITRRRIRFMAKRELFSSKFGGWLFRKLGAISVDREVTDRKAMRAVQAALESGEPVGIFPEGTRRKGPVLGELFDGVAYTAMKLGVPVLPVGIGGSEEILATGKVIPKLHKVVVVVGAPIATTPAGAGTGVRRRSEVQSVSVELRDRLQECLDAARRGAGESVAPAGEVREHE